MNEIKKITEAELAEIKMLQAKFQETIFKLGNLQIEKMELDRLLTDFIAKEKQSKEDWINLQKMERDLLDKIVKTYGEGNLNMNDGTFAPSPAESKIV